MSDDLFGAPAGWYPDPLGLPQLRWWNNHAWTEQTSAARQPMVVQDTKFAWADDELPTRREERERERSRDDRNPTTPEVPTVDSLRELEPPRAFTQVSQGVPSAPAAPAAAAPAAPAAPAPAPAAAAAPATPVAETPQFAQPTFAQPTQPAAAQPAYSQPEFTQPEFAQPAAAQPTAAQPTPSLYTPDPIVEPINQPAGPSSFDRIFDAKPAAAAPDQALDALFGAKPTRRTATRVSTPIFTADQLPATATGSRGNLPSSTGPVWVMAMIPLLQLVVSLLLVTAPGMVANTLLFGSILVVPYFIGVLLAYLDNRTLKAAGYEKPAHWGWAFLSTPVYLLVRARTVIRETGHGLGPVLTWFGVGLVHLASFVAVPGLIIALLPAVFSAQIEQSVASEAVLISTTQLTLDCPDTPPLLPDGQIVCPAVSGTGNQFNITVAQERANGWIKWQVIDWGVFTG